MTNWGSNEMKNNLLNGQTSYVEFVAQFKLDPRIIHVNSYD